MYMIALLSHHYPGAPSQLWALQREAGPSAFGELLGVMLAERHAVKSQPCMAKSSSMAIKPQGARLPWHACVSWWHRSGTICSQHSTERVVNSVERMVNSVTAP